MTVTAKPLLLRIVTPRPLHVVAAPRGIVPDLMRLLALVTVTSAGYTGNFRPRLRTRTRAI
jgi:hypothetical protein